MRLVVCQRTERMTTDLTKENDVARNVASGGNWHLMLRLMFGFHHIFC